MIKGALGLCPDQSLMDTRWTHKYECCGTSLMYMTLFDNDCPRIITAITLVRRRSPGLLDDPVIVSEPVSPRDRSHLPQDPHYPEDGIFWPVFNRHIRNMDREEFERYEPEIQRAILGEFPRARTAIGRWVRDGPLFIDGQLLGPENGPSIFDNHDLSSEAPLNHPRDGNVRTSTRSMHPPSSPVEP